MRKWGLRVWPTLFASLVSTQPKEDRTAAVAPTTGADSSHATALQGADPCQGTRRASRPIHQRKTRRVGRPRFMVEIKKPRRSGSNDRRGGRDQGAPICTG